MKETRRTQCGHTKNQPLDRRYLGFSSFLRTKRILEEDIMASACACDRRNGGSRKGDGGGNSAPFCELPRLLQQHPRPSFSRQDWRIDLRYSGLRVQASLANQSSGIPTGCRMGTCIWEARALSALRLRCGMPLSGKT